MYQDQQAGEAASAKAKAERGEDDDDSDASEDPLGLEDGEGYSDEEVNDTVTKEERRRRAEHLTQTQPLSQDDFDTIRRLQLEQKFNPGTVRPFWCAASIY